MSDPDLEMEQRLREFARSTRTPPLPTATASLPWAVQSEPERGGLRGWLPSISSLTSRAGRSAFAVARIGATLSLAFGLLLVANSTHSSGSAADIVPPPPSPRPTPVAGAPAGPEVVVLPTSGVVDDVMASYVAGGVKRAESDGAAAVIIQLDTLGGAESSMMRIVQSLHATIPTIVWVGPSGAKAASAGTFITLAANLDYMAESTNIGAAKPVAFGGQDIGKVYGQDEASKVLNDAIATMKSIAQERHPNVFDPQNPHPNSVALAVSTVSEARSFTATEAVGAGFVNDKANSLEEVLTRAEGQIVKINGVDVIVHTKGATIVTIGEDPIQSILHGLDDPNIAFILLVIGILCVLVEFFHPTLLMGLIGAFSLALSFYGSGSLPLNILGVVLVALGIGMLVLEPAIPSHGLLTIGGIVSFIVGAVAFYGSPGPYMPAVNVAWPIIFVMAVAAAAYGLILVSTLLKLRHQVVPAGSGMVGYVDVIGMTGVVEKDLAPLGTVYVARESWSARMSGDRSSTRGSKVRVVSKEGVTLVVEPVE
jgi:membrane-bound serine protease (ClpP class)